MTMIVMGALFVLAIVCIAACTLKWSGDRRKLKQSEAKFQAAEAATLKRQREDDRRLFSKEDLSSPKASSHEQRKRAVRSHAERRRRIMRLDPEESTDDDLKGAMLITAAVTGAMTLQEAQADAQADTPEQSYSSYDSSTYDSGDCE